MRARSVLVVVLLAAPAAILNAEAVPFRVIVHPSNPSTSIDRKFLADAFLKRTTRWGDDTVIRPVDLDTDSVIRRKFSESVIRRSVSAVKSYWQQRVFAGQDVPPPEFDTDEAVIAYVLKNPGAVGYVSGNANVANVKLIAIK